MMPSFALGRSNNAGLVEKQTLSIPGWAFDGHEKGEGSIAKMYDCISFFYDHHDFSLPNRGTGRKSS